MKRFYTSYTDVAHLWANQSQDEARTPNYYFNRNIVYSYGSHFPIANLYNNNVVLFTHRGYSVTTAKHLQATKYALSIEQREKIIYVYDPEFKPNDKLDVLGYAVNELTQFRNELKPQVEKIVKARKPENYIPVFMRDLENIEKFKAFIACELSRFPTITEHANVLKTRKSNYIKLVNEIKKLGKIDNLDKLKTEIAARVEKERLAKLKRDKEAVIKFKAFEPNCDYVSSDITYLRVNGETVQTSLGIKIPFEDARNLYRAFKAKKLVGLVFDRYTITSVANEHIKAGCHNIPFNEVEQAAQLMGIAI